MQKTILIYSGGLDSTVCLYHLRATGHSVKCLGVDYGQRHRRELLGALKICQSLGVEYRTADLSALKPLLAGSSQTDDSVPVPHGHYAAENMKLTVVPNRNMLMLAVAGAWAISTKSDSVAYAAHAGDHAIYPDCRDEFVEPLAEAFQNADWHKVGIVRPFLSMTKAEIVKVGASLGVPFADTYSCYGGGEAHCALCGTCQERRWAFIAAGVPDPTRYDPAGLAEMPDSRLTA
jgi:7-cyano-7-deazaguanine synthase